MGMFDFLGGKKKSSSSDSKSSLGSKDAMSSFSNGPAMSTGSPSSNFSSPRDPFKTPPSRPGMDNFASQSPMNTSQHSMMPGSGMDPNQGMSGSQNMNGEDMYQSKISTMQSQTSQHGMNQYEQTPKIHGGDAMLNKNIEIIMSKLDAIRVAVENLDHRMSALESSMQQKTNSNDYGKW
jgi:hypothetical protein